MRLGAPGLDTDGVVTPDGPATAFVLAAGLGTRLRPLTLGTPKPLLPVGGRPMLDHVVDRLRAAGHTHILVNAHWLAEQVVAWAATRPGIEVVVEAPELLGTGGGLRNARDRLADRFTVVNGDILCDADLTCLDGRDAPAVMLVRPQSGAQFTPVAVRDGRVAGIAGVVGEASGAFHFTGIHRLERRVLDLVPPGPQSIIDTVYRQLVPRGEVVAIAYDGVWTDIGTLEEYERVRSGEFGNSG